MSDTALTSTLIHYQNRSNAQLTHWLDSLGHDDQPLIQAMKHGALLGGKRVRPYLTYVTGKLFGVSEEALDTPAAAIECIHAYSLIHDDLPAMDDDALRRGQPTCHVAFDEASAILAGDALQTLAFTILAEGDLSSEGDAYRIQMVKELAAASGAAGMCLGQALDLAAEGKKVDLEVLETIHRNKTGALIRCAVRLGALAAGEKGVTYLSQLDTFSNAIGLAFQVQDDILDIISDTETLGKPQGSDLEAEKSTYPALLGLEGAQQKAELLYKEALQALQAIPYNTEQLELFARYIIERKN
ncbi:(2E,6E)-farnesyl diphosphate synthase [Grimontia kaedaensis]|uniref:(2E,6E)-farnesyl diphosphate synthase n=1 Tax=Grimontia kaedaensis TaxID=2872157 RepID=A0ABY4WRQ3_9GAMM|nr:(2E,6E)-farnesyl diphosphate synthase [Grimontia kaedaensis]USH01842.1 (2E,6E)-farnesyl diphosphate synthase [Grimontia kaedaensis]